MEEDTIIYIENDTVSAFNVKKGEPIRPKGLDSIKLDAKESVSNFCKILRDKYNIDDFSEIDMSICLVDEGADEEKLTALREELQNAHKFYENTTKKNKNIMKDLKGTKTEKNLQEAFAGESQARNKYTYFASKARKDGYEQIAAIFEETANNEKEHAKLWFKYLEGVERHRRHPCLII